MEHLKWMSKMPKTPHFKSYLKFTNNTQYTVKIWTIIFNINVVLIEKYLVYNVSLTFVFSVLGQKVQ